MDCEYYFDIYNPSGVQIGTGRPVWETGGVLQLKYGTSSTVTVNTGNYVTPTGYTCTGGTSGGTTTVEVVLEVGTTSVDLIGTAPSAFYLMGSLVICLGLFVSMIFYFKNR